MPRASADLAVPAGHEWLSGMGGSMSGMGGSMSSMGGSIPCGGGGSMGSSPSSMGGVEAPCPPPLCPLGLPHVSQTLGTTPLGAQPPRQALVSSSAAPPAARPGQYPGHPSAIWTDDGAAPSYFHESYFQPHPTREKAPR